MRKIHVASSIALLVCLVASSTWAQWTWTPETGRLVNLKNLPKETAELQLEHGRSLLVANDFDLAIRATEKFQEYYTDDPMADKNQYLRGEIRLAQEKYEDAAEEFQVVVASYPESTLYNQVIDEQYKIGDMLFERGRERLEHYRDQRWYRLDKTLKPFKRKPLKQATNVYTMVIDNQPFTAEAAQAQYKLGLCQLAQERYEEAAFEFSRVLEDYAGSNWVKEAAFGLADCYNLGSHAPEYDQSPSQLAINTIDELARLYTSDARIEDLQGVRAEMVEKIAEQRYQTAEAYDRAKQPFAARLGFEVILDKYPNTEAARKAQDWLDANQRPNTAYQRFIGSAVLE
jgi:TolA-binding protein